MININYEMHGKYQLLVMKNGKVVRKTKPFKNLITNGGLNQYCGGAAWGTWGFAGSGNTPPEFTNTDMQAFMGETDVSSVNTSLSSFVTPRYYVRQITYSFAVGAVVGNVSEVGCGWKTGSTRNAFSRALVVDGGGAPTTLTVLADEQLVLIYTLYVKIPDADTTAVVNDGTNDITVTARPVFPSSSPGHNNFGSGAIGANTETWIAAVKETDVLTAYGNDWATVGQTSLTPAPLAYTNGNFYRDYQFTVPGNVANFATGIGSAYCTTRGGAGKWTFGFSPKIPKASGQQVRFTMRLSWTRSVAP